MSSNGNSGAFPDQPSQPSDPHSAESAAGPVAKRTGPWVLLGMVLAVTLTAGAFFLLKSAAVKPPVLPIPQPTPSGHR